MYRSGYTCGYSSLQKSNINSNLHFLATGRFCLTSIGDVQKSVPLQLARLLLHITIGYRSDSHPRINRVLQKPLAVVK
jgi:hypothetical protein